MQKKLNPTDLIVAVCFLVLGLYLTFSGSGLPAGAGFFPQVIGLVTLALGCGLVLESFIGGKPGGFTVGHPGALAGVAVLTAAYLALWGTGLFPLRTFVFIAVFLRFLGESWKTGAAVSAVLTGSVTVAFQYGLRLSLD